MTFSILAIDHDSGDIGGAAATGSLCVGGWVLRADPRAGASASQGAAPSTFWGEDVLTQMRAGVPAGRAVAEVTGADPNRAARQLSAIGLDGSTGAFTGHDNTAARGDRSRPGLVVAGNLLARETVLDAMVGAFDAAEGPLPARLMAALEAAESSGSDSRGLLSAALHVVNPARPPLTLRIDHDATPLDRLRALYDTATTGDYAAWTRTVPVLEDPTRR